MGTYIGKPMPRIEDARLTTGEGTYIDDLNPLPNIHHAAIVRSPYAHARIKSIRADEALECRGVIGVVTAKDIVPLLNPFPVGVNVPVAYYPLAVDKVRYVGEPVAVVVAKNRYLAEDALAHIHVEYEPLPAVIDIEAALRDDAPVLHENIGNNIANRRVF
ncbi:MAG TPA: xanthine dehydrogenase family protein molybdopterin-binding subunit, partial [Alicyclobacillus sp.]|nr:xanthine dehydrogenase family protein molybdopterin-binding subunit [Alicyclobacillus sp.]